MVEKTGEHQYHSQFPNINQITCLLWMRKQHNGTDMQRSVPFSTSQWQPDHLQAMNERAIGWNRQADISTFSTPQWQSEHLQATNRSNHMEQTDKDQHHPQFSNDNQTTYFLWVREQQDRTDRQTSASFSILQWPSDHLLPMNERATGWNIQAEINTILNSLMTIRPLTSYEWESNKVEQTSRDQHHSQFPNDHQTTHKLCMRATGQNIQTEISTIHNFLATIRPLTPYE